jgi:hypothetical protein
LSGQANHEGRAAGQRQGKTNEQFHLAFIIGILEAEVKDEKAGMAESLTQRRGASKPPAKGIEPRISRISRMKPPPSESILYP